MKSLLLSAAVLFAMSSIPLQAADISMEPEAHDWSGFYIGAHAGYGGTDVNGKFDTDDIVSPDQSFLDDGEGPFDMNVDGLFGGVQAGINWQSGSFVIGLEGDVSFVDWSNQIESDVDTDEVVSSETDFVATLRGRAGFALDNLLLFGTAGLAFTDSTFTADDNATTPGVDVGSVDFNDIGLALGGGAEYALDERWSVKAEGLYILFNDKKDTDDLTSDSDPGDFAELDAAWMARIGMNFHF
jgi:outer membrane immunogenic protein